MISEAADNSRAFMPTTCWHHTAKHALCSACWHHTAKRAIHEIKRMAEMCALTYCSMISICLQLPGEHVKSVKVAAHQHVHQNVRTRWHRTATIPPSACS